LTARISWGCAPTMMSNRGAPSRKWLLGSGSRVDPHSANGQPALGFYRVDPNSPTGGHVALWFLPWPKTRSRQSPGLAAGVSSPVLGCLNPLPKPNSIDPAEL
jgi:hypothetical protein